MSSRIVALRKKELGAFYTHQGLTDLICAWAIVSPNVTVLEPSFGGCGFLRSARDRLISIGSNAAPSQIYGCDIDPTAFSHLSDLFEQPIDLENFHEGDFLDQSFPSSWPQRFDTIVGNPPYLPYRKIDTEQREQVLRSLVGQDLELDRRASLWAYFVAISVARVARGGRMAWVLPSSFLYANYSEKLRKFVRQNFDDVCAFELKERQFLLEGTEEKTVVLLAKDKLANDKVGVSSDIQLVQCDGVKDLGPAIRNWSDGQLNVSASCGSSVLDSLTSGPKSLFTKLRTDDSCSILKDHLQVRIGLVTGNNTFFVLDEQRREELDLREAELGKILPRFHFAKGLGFQQEDHDVLLANGGRGNLVSVSDQNGLSVPLQSYLDGYDADAKERCSTFKKRLIWCLTEDNSPPDAFLPVMHHLGPRLVLNDAHINCTNTIHRVYFNDGLTRHQRRLICISLLSTFSQISAETCGRSYGSGALKHEPREAEKIEVLLPVVSHNRINSAFKKIDRMLRDGNLDEARQVADVLILEALEITDPQSSIAILRSGLQQLRDHRHR